MRRAPDTRFLVTLAAISLINPLAVHMFLPAMPVVKAAFGISDALVGLTFSITLFVMAFVTLVYGSLSDRLGRRPVLLAGVALYVILSLLSTIAPSLEWLLALRVGQGVASAASGVIPRSIVRDRYDGATMARVLSIIFMVFLLVPILAPSLGQVLLWVMPWRGIFGVLGLAGAGVAVWVALRLPETLHPEYKRAPRARALLEAGWFVVTERASICYTLAMTALFGSVIAYVSTVPQIFAGTFHRRELMAPTFAFCAGVMGVAAFLNSRIVERLGMRRISHTALMAYLAVTLAHALIALHGGESIATFAVLQGLSMACIGLSASNFSAIAMQPMGTIAGSAASIQGVISMICGGLIAATIGQQWSGSVAFLPVGFVCCGLSALALVLLAERGTLFRNREPTPADTLAAGLDLGAS